MPKLELVDSLISLRLPVPDRFLIERTDSLGWKITTEDLAQCGADLGRFSFREFTFSFVPGPGVSDLRTRAFNRAGASQPMEALWNPSGYMRNVVESVKINAA